MCLSGILGLLIWIIIVIAVAAIVRVVLSFVPAPAFVIQIANIVLWAFVAIACLYVVFDLMSCVMPFPRLR